LLESGLGIGLATGDPDKLKETDRFFFDPFFGFFTITPEGF
jgi:hypothetical protein